MNGCVRGCLWQDEFRVIKVRRNPRGGGKFLYGTVLITAAGSHGLANCDSQCLMGTKGEENTAACVGKI